VVPLLLPLPLPPPLLLLPLLATDLADKVCLVEVSPCRPMPALVRLSNILPTARRRAEE